MNIELITHIIKQILERENFPTKSLEGIVGVACSSAFTDEELASLIIETNDEEILALWVWQNGRFKSFDWKGRISDFYLPTHRLCCLGSELLASIRMFHQVQKHGVLKTGFNIISSCL